MRGIWSPWGQNIVVAVHSLDMQVAPRRGWAEIISKLSRGILGRAPLFSAGSTMTCRTEERKKKKEAKTSI